MCGRRVSLVAHIHPIAPQDAWSPELPLRGYFLGAPTIFAPRASGFLHKDLREGLPSTLLPRLSEWGTSNAPTVNLAGIRRTKCTPRYQPPNNLDQKPRRSGSSFVNCPSRVRVPPRVFGREPAPSANSVPDSDTLGDSSGEDGAES